MNFRRHDLLDVEPDWWDEAVAALVLPPEAHQTVADWTRRGRPVIVRRRCFDDDRDKVPVALQLPNTHGRLRVGLSLPAQAVTPRARVDLDAAAMVAPAAWRDLIDAVLDLGATFGIPAVYGGLMWQLLLGEPMLRAGSDLDLLWRPLPADRKSLVTALDRLDQGPVRVDGEVEIEDGAVSWRELRSASADDTHKVLVKTIDGIELRDAATILRHERATC